MDMDKWTLLENEQDIIGRIRQLKRENKGHFFTNYQIFNSGLDRELDYMEVFYRQDDNNLFVIKRCDDFYKLLYGMGGTKINSAMFPRSVQKGVIVCDIVETAGKEKQTEMIKNLQEAGFSNYKKYHLWECVQMEFKMPAFRVYKIADDKSPEHLSNIYSIFDPYSDMLPLKRMFHEFLRERYSLSCFKNGHYEGSLIYMVNGKTATVEFIYTLKNGNGIGGILLMKFVGKCFINRGVRKLYAWINDDNDASIKTHKSAGFEMTDQYKITLIKGKT